MNTNNTDNTDNTVIGFIENVVKTGLLINIEEIIIEPNAVRAIDEHRTVVIYHTQDIPAMSFGSIGLTRIQSFMNRLDSIKSRDGFSVEVEVADNQTSDVSHALRVQMKSTDTKISFRCANPETIHAPKKINDTIVYQVQLNSDAIDMLQRGANAMGVDNVTITGSDDGVSFEFRDITDDVFVHTFTSEVTHIKNETSYNFKHNYPFKTLFALFKQQSDGMFEIGTKGILCITVNNLKVYVLPQV